MLDAERRPPPKVPDLTQTSPMEDWTQVVAPTAADIERLAEAAFARLPEGFRRLCEGLVIQIVDFPDDETLEEMGAQG
jgi:predicted Zn-dependent protease with MMP-like domain